MGVEEAPRLYFADLAIRVWQDWVQKLYCEHLDGHEVYLTSSVVQLAVQTSDLIHHHHIRFSYRA